MRRIPPSQDLPKSTAQLPAESTQAPFPVPDPLRRRPRGTRFRWAIGLSAAAVLVLGAGYMYWATPQKPSMGPSAQPPAQPPAPPTAPQSARSTAQPPSDQVRTARAHLDRQDLTAARAALGNLPPAQAKDPTVRPLLGEVEKQEVRRDSELKAARECLQKKQWECAVDRAQSALTIDRSSDEAQRIVKEMGMRSLGLDPARMKETRPPSPPVTSRPAPSRGTAARGLGGDAASTSAECEVTLAAGRRALDARRFDEALERANDPIGALGFCPGLEKLKQDATRAKNEASR